MPDRPGRVSAALDRLVAEHALTHDPAQAEGACLLDGVVEALAADARAGLLRRIAGRRRPVTGAYLHGPVGTGKTLLMDLFFAAAPVTAKRRVHFHEFMDEVHSAIGAFRAGPRGRGTDADPVRAVVRPIIARTRLLCLDEFQVTDITNAMLLGRLFEKMFAGGVVLVATSNTPPEGLYENGLNRQLFLPFIALLERHVTVMALDGGRDHRRGRFVGQPVFHFGTGPAARAAMDALWARLTGGLQGAPATLVSLGRSIIVPRAAMGVARFDFAALCEAPLGARDYLKLALAYDALIVDGVPQFGRARSNAARRFIELVDTLYDRGVKLGASFAVPLDALGGDAWARFEMRRAVSRLAEMQSAGYLEAPRAPAVAAPPTEGGVQ